MRTLKDFLLAEVKLHEGGDDKEKETKSETSFEPPKGFKKIDARGRLSDQAKDLLGVVKISDGKAAAKTEEGAKAIRDKMKVASLPNEDPIKMLRKFFENKTVLSEFLTKSKEKDADDHIILQMGPSWQSIGGKSNPKSSLKVMKFWITSLMQAYGMAEPMEKAGILANAGVNQILVYKK